MQLPGQILILPILKEVVITIDPPLPQVLPRTIVQFQPVIFGKAPSKQCWTFWHQELETANLAHGHFGTRTIWQNLMNLSCQEFNPID